MSAAIKADSWAGRTLLALRAGCMTGAEMHERFASQSPALPGLIRQKLVVVTCDSEKGKAYMLTDAGRAACPLRNPLAGECPPAPVGAAGGRIVSDTPRTAATNPIRAAITHTKEPIMGKTPQNIVVNHSKDTVRNARAAIAAAIAGVDRESAVSRDMLIALVGTGTFECRTLQNIIKKMVNAGELAAFGNTGARRYFDARTAGDMPSRQIAMAPAVVRPAAKNTGAEAAQVVSAVDFSIYDDGRLAICDGDEVLVLPPADVRRLSAFLARVGAHALPVVL